MTLSESRHTRTERRSDSEPISKVQFSWHWKLKGAAQGSRVGKYIARNLICAFYANVHMVGFERTLASFQNGPLPVLALGLDGNFPLALLGGCVEGVKHEADFVER